MQTQELVLSSTPSFDTDVSVVPNGGFINPAIEAVKALNAIKAVPLNAARRVMVSCSHEECRQRVNSISAKCGICANPPERSEKEIAEGVPKREDKMVVFCFLHKGSHQHLHKQANDYQRVSNVTSKPRQMQSSSFHGYGGNAAF